MKGERNHLILEMFSLIISLMATIILGGSVAVFIKMTSTAKDLQNSTDGVIGWIVIIIGIVLFILLIATARALVLFLDIESKLTKSVIVQKEILEVLKDIKYSSRMTEKECEISAVFEKTDSK